MKMQRRKFVNLALAMMGLTKVSWAASRFVRIGAGTPGGAYFVCAGVISTLLETAGMRPRVQTTGGGRQNAILLDRAELDIAFMNNIEASQSVYEDNRRNIRSMLPFFTGIHHFVVRADQSIYSLSDLDGQPFGLSNRGSTHDVAGRQIFQILGINPKFQNASKVDTNNMVRDGLLKGYFVTSVIPMPAISELQATVDLRFLEFSDAEYSSVRSMAPWLAEDVISTGVYKGVNASIKSFSSWNVMMANKDVSDELVYELMDILYSNAAAIQRTYHAAALDPNLITKLILPLHAGAEAYYRDHGIEIPVELLS